MTVPIWYNPRMTTEVHLGPAALAALLTLAGCFSASDSSPVADDVAGRSDSGTAPSERPVESMIPGKQVTGEDDEDAGIVTSLGFCSPGIYVGSYTCDLLTMNGVSHGELTGDLQFELTTEQRGTLVDEITIDGSRAFGTLMPVVGGFESQLEGHVNCSTGEFSAISVGGVLGQPMLSDPTMADSPLVILDPAGTFEGSLTGLRSQEVIEGTWALLDENGNHCTGPFTASLDDSADPIGTSCQAACDAETEVCVRGKCECVLGFSTGAAGGLCTDVCQYANCGANERCLYKGRTVGDCSCYDGYADDGAGCIADPDCDLCGANTTCLGDPGDRSCTCAPGYAGGNPCLPISECDTVSCGTNAICHDLDYGHACACAEGYTWSESGGQCL